MSELSVNHLLGIKYITKNDIDLIFETADHFKEVINRPIKKVPSLRDITIANIFFENSTRTKLSFELAQKRLSADVISFSAAQSSVKKGETLIDTVNNILSMKVDMVVMRHANPGAAYFLSKNVKASIVNAGDGALRLCTFGWHGKCGAHFRLHHEQRRHRRRAHDDAVGEIRPAQRLLFRHLSHAACCGMSDDGAVHTGHGRGFWTLSVSRRVLCDRCQSFAQCGDGHVHAG